MTDSTSTGAGRRGATRRISAVGALAVLLPLLTAGALALVRPADTDVPAGIAPQTQALTRADVACPTALDAAEQVLVASSGRGRVTVRAAGQSSGEPASVSVTPGGVRAVQQPDPALLTGQDAVAPGLLAVRAGGSPVAAIACPAPTDGQWFSALGGRFEHSSVIELVNPDQGAAVADLSIHTSNGLVSSSALRGLSVPGRSVRRVNLAEELPRASLMSVEVIVSRGRLSAGVADEVGQVGDDRPVLDWIPAQAEPAQQLVMLGLVPGAGARTVVLTNPSADEISVQVEVVNKRSTFTPTGWEEIRVAPGAVTSVPIAGLAQQVRKGALGLRLTSSAPVVAGLRQKVSGDVSHLAPATADEGMTRTLLPGGPARLVLGGSSGSGEAVVTARAANGQRVLRRQLTVGAARAAEVALPERAASVQVRTDAGAVPGVVVLGGTGHAVLPLVQPAEQGEVPAVRPALR